MILSNREIIRAVSEGRIEIDPPPDLGNADTTALDLHLSDVFLIPKDIDGITICPIGKNVKKMLHEMYEKKGIESDGHLILRPNQFILGCTYERISIPVSPDKETGCCLAARVEGKSSLARCGLLVHFTAPVIHAHFRGNIALEMINLGRYAIELRPLMPICQIVFELVRGNPFLNVSQFQNQADPAGRE